MKVTNTSSVPVKIISNGKPLEIKKGVIVDLDEKTISLLKKICPSLEIVEEVKEEPKEVIIEAEPQEIETKKKVKKNASGKKSK